MNNSVSAIICGGLFSAVVLATGYELGRRRGYRQGHQDGVTTMAMEVIKRINENEKKEQSKSGNEES